VVRPKSENYGRAQGSGRVHTGARVLDLWGRTKKKKTQYLNKHRTKGARMVHDSFQVAEVMT